MSLKEYNNLNDEITKIYIETCLPCMEKSLFFTGDCKTCDTMKTYIALQEKKKAMEVD